MFTWAAKQLTCSFWGLSKKHGGDLGHVYTQLIIQCVLNGVFTPISEGFTLSFSITTDERQRIFQNGFTLPETNIAPKNGGFQ